MSAADFVTGVVKWFSPTKGYGFIISDTGKEIFVHSKRLRESGMAVAPDPTATPLETGNKLKFRIENGPKGAFAVEISKVIA